MDWNWFFSSLAQSAAAIVGLFGAFVVTKIVANDAEYKRNRAKSQELIHYSEFLRDRAEARNFSWYNEGSSAVSLDHLWGKLTRERDRKTPEEYYREHSFSPFMPKQDALMRIAHLIEEHRQLEERQGGFPRVTTLWGGSNAQEEREQIEQVIIEIRQHIRLVRSLAALMRSNPESSPQIADSIVALVALFYAGVIYPLSFLPIQGKPVITSSPGVVLDSLFSFRGALLAIISIIFTGIMIAFFIVNRRLRYDSGDIEALQAWEPLGAYSPYLAVLEENQRNLVQKAQASGVSAEANHDDRADG